MTVARAFARILWLVCVLCLSQSTGAAARQDPAVSLQQIQSALERGDVDGARTAVEAGLRAYPDDPALQNFAGVIAAQRGDWAAAESHFREAIRLAPRAVPPYENLGRLYQVRSVADPAARAKALDVYRALLSVDPTNREGLFQAALLRAQAGEFAASRALLEQFRTMCMTTSGARRGCREPGGTGDATSAAPQTRWRRIPTSCPKTCSSCCPPSTTCRATRCSALLPRSTERGVVAQICPTAGGDPLHRGQFATHGGRWSASRRSSPRPVLVDLGRAAAKLGTHRGALEYLAHARALDRRTPPCTSCSASW